MPVELLRVERRLQMWSYVFSHSSVLLRATKNEAHPTRLDVLFKGVGAMQMPVFMDALIVREATEAERDEILASTAVDVPEERRYMTLEGPGFRGWVVAGYVGVKEYWEPSSLVADVYGVPGFEFPTAPDDGEQP
jgi:hypothetical protein